MFLNLTNKCSLVHYEEKKLQENLVAIVLGTQTHLKHVDSSEQSKG